MKKPHPKAISLKLSVEYGGLIGGIAELLEAAAAMRRERLTLS